MADVRGRDRPTIAAALATVSAAGAAAAFATAVAAAAVAAASVAAAALPTTVASVTILSCHARRGVYHGLPPRRRVLTFG